MLATNLTLVSPVNSSFARTVISGTNSERITNPMCLSSIGTAIIGCSNFFVFAVLLKKFQTIKKQ